MDETTAALSSSSSSPLFLFLSFISLLFSHSSLVVNFDAHSMSELLMVGGFFSKLKCGIS
jgi:hypothetical protein